MSISHAGRRNKGNAAEREVLTLLRDSLGDHIVRTRLEGEQDRGDISLPEMTLQVKNYSDVVRAVREGLDGASEQRARNGHQWGAAVIRRRGGRYFVAMEFDDWLSLYREATI